MLRRLFLTTSALTAMSGFALAADMPLVAPVPAFTWTGFYIGGNVGYGWGRADPGTIIFYQPISVPVGSIQGINDDMHGVIGGGQAGYNQQFGNVLLGIEGDFSGTGIKGSVTDPVNNYTATSQIDWLTTVRGRFGFTFDHALLYATGGFAAGHVKATLNDVYSSGVITTTSGTDRAGWTVGGGIEWALSPNWTAKAEYLYVDLGSKQDNFFEPSPGWPLISGKTSVTTSIVRVGVNYLFGDNS
jgi:outer membrane immunogenic protein